MKSSRENIHTDTLGCKGLRGEVLSIEPIGHT